MQRSNLFLFFSLLLFMFSCDFVKKSKELAFNRYKISTPSMSPNLNVGETYAAFTSDTFQINQVVVYSPVKRLREENDKVVYLHRLVGMPGDHLEMKEAELFLNGKAYPYILNLKHSYKVLTTAPLSEAFIQKFEYAGMQMSNEYMSQTK